MPRKPAITKGELEKYLAMKLTSGQIAERTGLSAGTICQAVKRHGLKLNPYKALNFKELRKRLPSDKIKLEINPRGI